jgi:trigger factor
MEEKPKDPEAVGEDQEQEEAPRTSRNTVTIEEAGPCKKKVIIEIPEESIKEAIDEQYQELGREAVLPGFRKGRAPRRLLEKRFGKETSEQVKLKLLAESSEAAIKDKELDILGDPDIDYEKVELPASGPMKFEFEAEVRPEFELPKLEGIPVTRAKLEVTDEQIDREIDQLRRWSGVWTPKEEGAVERDDQVIADVLLKPELTEEEKAQQAKEADEAAKGEEGEEAKVIAAETKLDDAEIYVRPSGFVGEVPVEKLDELLTGAKAGEKKTTTVEVPKTYFNEDYRGRKVEIELTIKDIKYLKPAEINEPFLQRFGAESEEELRQLVQDNLQSQLESRIRNEMSDQVYKYLLEKTDFDLPLDIVARQAGTLLQRQYINLLSRGLSRQQLDEQMEQLRAGSEEQAKEQLKTFFIMDKVADKLEIEVTEEEINGHIAQIAIQRGQRPEKMKEQMERDGSLAQFRMDVRQNKCINQLLETADITEQEAKGAEGKPTKAKKTAKKSAEDKAEKEDQ